MKTEKTVSAEKKYKVSTTILETITPDRARKIIERNGKNGRNRNLSLNLVKDYARAILEKRWRSNGETIKIGYDGSLLDGQHRLHACIQANVSFTTFVAYDIDPDTFDTIDIGRKRTGGDVLAIEGCKNANVVSAMIRWIDAMEAQSTTGAIRLTADEIRLRWVTDSMLEESASQALHAKKILPPGMGAALHYLFAKRDRDAADQFFTDLGGGIGLAETDSVYVFRERLIGEKLGKAKTLPEEKLAVGIRAWNHRRENKPTKILRGMVLDSDGVRTFPEIK